MREKKIFMLGACVFIVFLMALPLAAAYNTTKTEQRTLQEPHLRYVITVNRQNITSVFHIILVKISVQNLDNDTIELMIGGKPGGGFSIHDSTGAPINSFPRLYLTLLWNLTLQPGAETMLFQGLWFQRNVLGTLVHNGDYQIYGTTSLIYWNDQPITPEPFGPVNITIARRFMP